MFRLLSRNSKNLRNFSTNSSTVSNTTLVNNKKKYKLASGFFIFTALVTVSLGVWQSKRYFYKVDLIEKLKEDLALPPLDYEVYNINNELDEKITRRRVLIKGTYDYSKEFLVSRACPPGLLGPAAKGMATNPQGYFVYTPLKTNKGEVIIVNRGWVPRTASSWDRPEGEVAVTVIHSPYEQGGSFAPIQKVESLTEVSTNFGPLKSLIWMDESVVKDLTKSNEVQVYDTVLNNSETVKSSIGPYSKPSELFLKQSIEPETHLGYAATWYSLALFSLGITTKFLKQIK